MRKIGQWTSAILILVASYSANSVTVDELNTYFNQGDQCLGSMLDRYIWVRGKDEDWKNRNLRFRYESAQKLYEVQSEAGFKTLFNGAWDRALVPIFEAQRDVIFDSLLTIDSTGELVKGAQYNSQDEILSLAPVERYLRSGRPTHFVSLIESVGKAFGAKTKKIDELLTPKSPDEDYLSAIKNTALIALACGQISSLKAASCIAATSDLLAEANFNANMILPKVWMELITDSRLREGMRQAALIMIERIKTQKVGYVFADLSNGFQKAGLNKVDAEEASWKVLALYGNGGPNAAYRLSAFDLPDETSHMKVALSIVGSAISYLDFLQTIKQRTHYAFPPEVSGCLSPKPYHFWLNAYFSRWLVKKGYSSDVAQMATFIVAKGYQVHRNVNNAGGGLEKILSKPSDHPTNQVVRMDLTLTAAGNVYGALIGQQKIKPMKLSQGLNRLQEVRGQTQEASQDWLQNLMGSDRTRAYLAWDQIFNPNEVLVFFSNGQK